MKEGLYASRFIICMLIESTVDPQCLKIHPTSQDAARSPIFGGTNLIGEDGHTDQFSNDTLQKRGDLAR